MAFPTRENVCRGGEGQGAEQCDSSRRTSIGFFPLFPRSKLPGGVGRSEAVFRQEPTLPDCGIWLQLHSNSCVGIINLSPGDEAQRLSMCPANGKSVSAHSTSSGL